MSFKKWLAMLLALCMLCSMAPAALMEQAVEAVEALPEEAEDVFSDSVEQSIPEQSDFALLPGDGDAEEAEPNAGFDEEAAVESNDSLDSFEIVDGVITRYKGTATAVTIPESITGIGDSAFSNTPVVSVTMRSGASIGSRAFSGCRSLTSVTLPDTLTTIGDYAFSDCTSLEHITLTNSITFLGSNAFANCIALAEIAIPA